MMACVLAMLVASGNGVAASSSTTVVSATVPSATSLDTSGCATDTPNVTSFGSVTPGSSTVTSLDCVVMFGSSNDTATVRIAQADALGDAMYQELGRGGALDGGFAAGAGMLVDANVIVSNASVRNSSGGIARQSDGKLLVTGENGSAIIVRRYLPDGTLDAGFGPVSVAPCASSQDVTGIVVASDDSFIIAGDSGTICPTIGAWAMRFGRDGARDMSYGGDGIADSGFAYEIRDLALFADGTTMLVGGDGGFELIRLKPSGAPDLDFSGDGHHTLTGLPTTADARGVEAMSDGSVIVSGLINIGGTSNAETMVARVLPSSAYHATFGGGDGWEATSHATVMKGRSLAIGRDGSVYVGAYEGIVKFTPAGLVDGTFGTNGVFDLAATQPLARLNDAMVQHDGSVIGIGQWNADTVVVVRVTPGGSLDSTFGSNGVQIHDPAGTGNGANRAVWADDGDLVTFGPGSSGASIVRLDGRTISDYDNTAANWTTAGTNAFGACLASVAAGAGALWTTDGSCTAANGLDWNEVTPTASPIARTTVATTQGATANLRFGMRTLVSQAAGTYVAPITFSVVAPNA